MLQFTLFIEYIIYMEVNKMRKGFYIACEETEAYGISFNIVYIPREKDFQISLMLGNLNIAIGYTF